MNQFYMVTNIFVNLGLFWVKSYKENKQNHRDGELYIEKKIHSNYQYTSNM